MGLAEAGHTARRARAAGGIVRGARAPLAARGRWGPQWSLKRRGASRPALTSLVPGPAALLAPAPPSLQVILHRLRHPPHFASRPTPFPSLLVRAQVS